MTAPGECGPDVLGLLASLDTCALSDALDLLGLPGAIVGLSPLTAGRRISGRAITVRLTAAGPAPAARHLCTAAIEAGGPGTVIVVEHPGVAAAGWGGILSLAAIIRGIEGVIVDGPVRDVDEAAALGFAVFARSATPVTARGRLAEASWNEPVTIAGSPVAAGDLVIADRSGVVFLPAQRAGEIAAIAASLAAREALMSLAVRGGAPVSEVMGAAYERLTATAGQEES